MGGFDTLLHSPIGTETGGTVELTGTVSDFDKAGLFGLIAADDGRVLLFNLRGAPAALRNRFEIGTRVRINKHTAEPIARAVEVAPIDDSADRESSSPSAPKV
jgi:hypothetical protein